VKKRRIVKKRLKKLEGQFCELLRAYSRDFSSAEFLSQLDFWLAYYVSCALNLTEKSGLFCDGALWKDGVLCSEFIELLDRQFVVHALLDLQDESTVYPGRLRLSLWVDPTGRFVCKRSVLLDVSGEFYFIS
jgi:hypothetical protein